MTAHADKRFALFVPPPDDANFRRVIDHVFDVLHQAAWKQRVKCAAAHGISVWDTYATVVPDPNKPNFVTITAYPRAELMSDDKR